MGTVSVKPMIRAILFDAAGTLIHLPRGVGWHYQQIAARHGLHLEEKALASAFRDAFKNAPARLAAGDGLAGDDKSWWHALVRQVFSTCDATLPDREFDRLFEELYAHFAEPGGWAVYPEVPGILEALRGKYRLGILSNFDRRLYLVLDHLGIRRFFDIILISSEAGFQKPDPRIFAAALSALDVTPAQTIHAGDDPVEDWQAAVTAGLHSYRVDRPSKGLEELPVFITAVADAASG